MPDHAGEANFIKKDDDDEFDWDAEEDDRFSDDEGNDGAEFVDGRAEMPEAPDGMAEQEMREKDEKYGKDPDEAQCKVIYLFFVGTRRTNRIQAETSSRRNVVTY